MISGLWNSHHTQRRASAWMRGTKPQNNFGRETSTNGKRTAFPGPWAYLMRRKSRQAQNYPRTEGLLKLSAISERSRPLGAASFLQWTWPFWRQGQPKETQHTSAHTHRHRRIHIRAHTQEHHVSIQERTTTPTRTEKQTSYERRTDFI